MIGYIGAGGGFCELAGSDLPEYSINFCGAFDFKYTEEKFAKIHKTRYWVLKHNSINLVLTDRENGCKKCNMYNSGTEYYAYYVYKDKRFAKMRMGKVSFTGLYSRKEFCRKLGLFFNRQFVENSTKYMQDIDFTLFWEDFELLEAKYNIVDILS